jgi:hypothetical protein
MTSVSMTHRLSKVDVPEAHQAKIRFAQLRSYGADCIPQPWMICRLQSEERVRNESQQLCQEFICVALIGIALLLTFEQRDQEIP